MNVQQVVDRILAATATTPPPNTCDRLIAGRWDAEVTGIATTFMATVDVLRRAAAQGLNLIITHEPTFYTHMDETGWLAGDPVYKEKLRLIEAHGLNIWRFHDAIHMAAPDGIFRGLNEALGWQSYASDPTQPFLYELPPTRVGELADLLKARLNVAVSQIVGDPDMPVRRVGFLIGGASLGLGSDQWPMELMHRENLDLAICGEIYEWTLVAYARDAAQLGLPKALIILGHNRTEEAGMQYLPGWLAPLLPGVRVEFVEAGEPFGYR